MPQPIKRRTARSLISSLLSVQIALVPVLAAWPATSIAASQEALDIAQSAIPTTVATTVKQELDQLLERALAPQVLRYGPTGTPSIQEIDKVSAKVAHLRERLQSSFMDTLQSFDLKDEEDGVGPLSVYFEAVTQLETLKILIQQRPEPETWDELYSVRFPYLEFKEQDFIKVVGGYSRTSILDHKKYGPRPFVASVEAKDGQWQLVFRLRTDFMSGAEREALNIVASAQHALLFAAQFVAQRLFDSAHALAPFMELTAKDIPPSPQEITNHFPSLLNERQLAEDEDQSLLEKRKIHVFQLISEARQRAASTGHLWMFNTDFYTDLKKILGGTPKLADPETWAKIHKNELINFNASLLNLLNLSEPQSDENWIHFILFAAKRLSLRWAYIAATTQADKSDRTPEQIKALEKLTDDAAEAFASQLLTDGKLVPQIKFYLERYGIQDLAKARMVRMKHMLVERAQDLKYFMDRPIQLPILAAMNQSRLKEITDHSSPVIAGLLQKIKASPTYELAFELYYTVLLTYMQAIDLPLPIYSQPQIHLDEIIANRKEARWNPGRLKDLLSPELVKGMSSEARLNDFQSLLDLAQVFKFEKYERLPRQRREGRDEPDPNLADPTPRALGFDQGGWTTNWFSSIFKSEEKAYQEALRINLADASPLLASLTDSGQPLWQVLPNDPKDPKLAGLLERQIRKVWQRIQSDQAELADELRSIDHMVDDHPGSLGPRMKALVVRASQVQASLARLTGYALITPRLENDLLRGTPFEREYARFNDWSQTAFLAVMGFWLLQAGIKRIPGAGLATNTLINKVVGPVFGENLGALNLALGVTLIPSVYVSAQQSGWFGGLEAFRMETLQQFTSCGGEYPCVASEGDISNQQAILAKGQFEIEALGGFLAAGVAAPLAWKGLSGIYRKIEVRNQLLPLKRDLINFGVTANEEVNATALEQKLKDGLNIAARAKDPRTRKLGEVYVRSTFDRLNVRANELAVPFFKLQQKHSAALRLIGMESARDWSQADKVLEALNALEDLELQGQIAAESSIKVRSALEDIYTQMRPYWTATTKDPVLKPFMDYVFGYVADYAGTTENPAVDHFYGVRNFHSRQISDQLLKNLDRRFANEANPYEMMPDAPSSIQTHSSTSRLEALIRDIDDDLYYDPGLSPARLKSLLDQIRKESR